MSERKVLNKYIPPDFDPSKIPEGGGGRRHNRTVRLMTPFTMRCNTCGDYIYRRKKFNARKETVRGEDYLGIKVSVLIDSFLKDLSILYQMSPMCLRNYL
jgi:hypothetical protein